MSGHLSPDEVSDLDAGVLSGEATRRAETHLAGCAACTATRMSLSEVRAVLSQVGLQRAQPVPVDVLARLDAALAAEAARQESVLPPARAQWLAQSRPADRAARGTGDQHLRRSRHLTGSRRPAFAVRLLAAATVLGALGGAGALLTSAQQPAPTSGAAAGQDGARAGQAQDSAAAAAAGPTAGTAISPPADPSLGPASGPTDAAAGRPAGAARAAEASSAAAAAPLQAAPGPPGGGPDIAGRAAAIPSIPRVTATGRDYTSADLAAAAADLAAGRLPPGQAAGATNSGPATAAGTPPERRLADPAALQDCLAGLNSPGVPLVVDLARHLGAPVALLVLSVPADPQQLDIRVVGPGCTATDPQQRHAARAARS